MSDIDNQSVKEKNSLVEPIAICQNGLRTDQPGNRAQQYEVLLRKSLYSVKSNTRTLLQTSRVKIDSFSTDIQKIEQAAQQMLELVKQLFTTNNMKKFDIKHIPATAGHDLRTPVNIIIGFSEMLLEDFSEAEKLSSLGMGIQNILEAGHDLLAILNDLFGCIQAKNVEVQIDRQDTMVDDEPVSFGTCILPADNVELEKNSNTRHILIIDDKASNRELLARQLRGYGFRVSMADCGSGALRLLADQLVDLILLDILMPGMNGYQVLDHLKTDKILKNIPVLVLSALDEIDSVVHCIEKGAEDYLQKPFNKVILKTKINASLERKALRDGQVAYIKQIEEEQQKSEALLLNILPAAIADRLKQGENTIADNYSEATVLFADLANFTPLSSQISATKLVHQLNDIFKAFDVLVEHYQLEKIKTIGDAYMLAGGVPTPQCDHAIKVAEIALDMMDVMKRINRRNNSHLKLRIGIHSGPVVAGIIGNHKFSYDLWGDTVNVASRMESLSIPDSIQISAQTRAYLDNRFQISSRGNIQVKGKGDMHTYWLQRA